MSYTSVYSLSRVVEIWLRNIFAFLTPVELTLIEWFGFGVILIFIIIYLIKRKRGYSN